jgi:hypothetical protein
MMCWENKRHFRISEYVDAIRMDKNRPLRKPLAYHLLVERRNSNKLLDPAIATWVILKRHWRDIYGPEALIDPPPLEDGDIGCWGIRSDRRWMRNFSMNFTEPGSHRPKNGNEHTSDKEFQGRLKPIGKDRPESRSAFFANRNQNDEIV